MCIYTDLCLYNFCVQSIRHQNIWKCEKANIFFLLLAWFFGVTFSLCANIPSPIEWVRCQAGAKNQCQFYEMTWLWFGNHLCCASCALINLNDWIFRVLESCIKCHQQWYVNENPIFCRTFFAWYIIFSRLIFFSYGHENKYASI